MLTALVPSAPNFTWGLIFADLEEASQEMSAPDNIIDIGSAQHSERPHFDSSAQKQPMRAELVEKASEVIPHPPTLINMVSQRVRQLNQGRSPLVQVIERVGVADIALMEIIEGKVVLDEESGSLAEG